MSKIKVERDHELIEIELEEMKKGDVFALYDGSLHVCTDIPIMDYVDDCYYAQSGSDLFSEAMIVDMKEVYLEKEAINHESEKGLQGVVLENGNVQLWARVGMSFEVSKEEFEKLRELGLRDDSFNTSNLVCEWMQKGYVRTDGDSYFTDGEDHEINFDMPYMLISASKTARGIGKGTEENSVLWESMTKEQIIEAIKEAETSSWKDYERALSANGGRDGSSIAYAMKHQHAGILNLMEELGIEKKGPALSLDEKMKNAASRTGSNTEKSVQKGHEKEK